MAVPFLIKPSAKTDCGDFGIEIAHSCMFDGAQYLTMTPAVQTDRRLWIASISCKRTKLGVTQSLIGTSTGIGYDMHDLRFDTNDRLIFALAIGSTAVVIATTAVFRDPNQHLRVIAVFDSANPVAEDRMRIYVNGVRQTVTSIGSSPFPIAQNTQGFIGNGNPIRIGMTQYVNDYYQFAYLSDINFIWGQSFELDNFGYFNRYGVWVSRRYTGTYGVLGFRLDFSDASNLGKDVSGNNNHFTSVGLTSTNQVTDTPTHAFPTLNLLNKATALTLSNGNLDHIAGNGSYAPSTIATIRLPSTGKWWWASTATGTDYPLLGVAKSDIVIGATSGWPGGAVGLWAVRPGSFIYTNGTTTTISPFSQVAGDEFHMAYDADTGTLAFFKNGVYTGFQFTGLPSGLVVFTGGVINKAKLNFGQRPTVYTPPNGYKTLSTLNLPCPVIKTPDRFITTRIRSSGAGVSDLPWNPLIHPTLVRSKRRDSTAEWKLNLSILPGYSIDPVTSGLSVSEPDGLTWTEDGFTIGANSAYAGNRVDHIWRASPTSGCDLLLVDHVSGIPTTVSHNVGGVIDYAWVIPLDGGPIRVWHSSLNSGQYLRIAAAVASSDPGWWSSSASNLTLSGTLTTGRYAIWANRSVAQYSDFGKYTGSGSVDNRCITTDFTPRIFDTKDNISGSNGHWVTMDIDRSINNPVSALLYPSWNAAEATTTAVDILSNGVKIRTSSTPGNSGEYLYATWAKTPGKFAIAR